MSDQAYYVMDSNVLMTAHQRYYAHDIAPGFWSKILSHAQENKVVSIVQVNNIMNLSHEYSQVEPVLHYN